MNDQRHPLKLLLTESERAEWDAKAEALGISTPDFVRRAVAAFGEDDDLNLADLGRWAERIQEKAEILTANVRAVQIRGAN